ncbi:unnamed protein product [Mytilus edulis]|uniref:KCTD1_15 n=1 Tax=Mytilus edulis TaxID=6550 RepID=A0A8S3PQN0_MYTED|nr:unnamed protein product [Mytilus edulis]
MATKRRFASLEDEDRENLLENVDSKNTKRQTRTAINGFREYLTEKSLSLDFESYDDAQLDDVLSKFYMEMRNKNGEMYKKTTMQSYRQGLQRHLSKTRDIDILKGDNFKKSQKHINVFVDIMIHFGRRGRENLATLTRQDFAVQPDPEGTLYIYKTHDELTKNHQTDSEKSSDGRMYEIKGSDRCPVRSFVKYIRRLNPKCNKLFQQPKLTAKDGIHYDNIPLGHNKLGIYMNEISKAANLSKEYTNHSCRATTVHILDEAQIPSRHIMSVTGHKSEASLKTYSGKTCEKNKKMMSDTLSEKTLCKTSKVTKPATLSSNIDFCLSQTSVTVETEAISTTSFGSFNLQPLSDSQTQNLINDIIPEMAADDDDDGMDDLLKSLEVPRCIPKQSNSVNAASINQKAMPVPVFNNCSNITVNYNFIQKN